MVGDSRRPQVHKKRGWKITYLGENAGTRRVDAPSPNSERLDLVIEQLPYAAYKVNQKFEVTWLNSAARQAIPGLFGLFDLYSHTPQHAEARSIFNLLLDDGGGAIDDNTRAMLRLNLTVAKQRMSLAAIVQPLRAISALRTQLLGELYDEVASSRRQFFVELPLVLNADNRAQNFAAYAIAVSDGTLIVIAPREQDGNALRDLLCRRDQVIRTLLSQRLPMLTQLVVLVADLAQSVKICAELSPDEYFELINQIRATASDIFRKYYGTDGKHVGDGMVYYFFPQADSHYILDAAVCALELKSAMAHLSKDWQLRKNWLNELYLNIGLNEGQEWLGTFHTAHSLEFVALGETANASARLSQMAQFGQVWATKHFMSKLPAEHRDGIEFGIEHVGASGRHVLIRSIYSRVDDLVDVKADHNATLQEIAALSVTEIRHIGSLKNPTS